MIGRSYINYFGGAEIVFYDSNLGLYFSRGRYSFSEEDSVESMEWVNEWYDNGNRYKQSSYFANGDKITNLFKLLNDKGLEEGYGAYVIDMANNFKSIGLGNIWIVPADDELNIETDFSDCVRLVDIIR